VLVEDPQPFRRHFHDPALDMHALLAASAQSEPADLAPDEHDDLRGTFLSLGELSAQIRGFIPGCNIGKHPFVSTRSLGIWAMAGPPYQRAN
jgi:hypothetical protein